MRRTEFIQELQEVLQGEVPATVLQENVKYYDDYISQEAAKGRREDEIIEEIGGPRIIAKTIIDSSEAAAESAEASGTEAHYSANGTRSANEGAGPSMNAHYTNLNKWYWKLLLIVIIVVVLFVVFTVVGGIFSLFFRFAGPFIIIWLVISLLKGMRR